MNYEPESINWDNMDNSWCHFFTTKLQSLFIIAGIIGLTILWLFLFDKFYVKSSSAVNSPFIVDEYSCSKYPNVTFD